MQGREIVTGPWSRKISGSLRGQRPNLSLCEGAVPFWNCLSHSHGKEFLWETGQWFLRFIVFSIIEPGGKVPKQPTVSPFLLSRVQISFSFAFWEHAVISNWIFFLLSASLSAVLASITCAPFSPQVSNILAAWPDPRTIQWGTAGACTSWQYSLKQSQKANWLFHWSHWEVMPAILSIACLQQLGNDLQLAVSGLMSIVMIGGQWHMEPSHLETVDL